MYPERAPADLLVSDAELVATVDDQRREISGGWVTVRDGLVAAVDDARHTPPDATDTISAAGCLVTPGLINTHHHIYQNLTRAYAPAATGSLFEWLTTLYPMWAGLDEEAAYLSAWVGLAELALGGCTTSTDHLYVHPKGAGDLIGAEIAAASEIGMRFHPTDVRRVNLLPDAVRPWRGHGGQRIDPGPLHDLLDRLLDQFGSRQWCARRDQARASGRLVGVGVSTLIQGTAPTQHDTAGRFSSMEMAVLTVLPDGKVEVRVGTKSQGQAHETVLAQVAADTLGIPAERVEIKDGDTDSLPFGQGTWGSRNAVMAGGAVIRAARQTRARMVEMAGVLGHPLPELGPVPLTSFDRVASVAWWHPHLLPRGMEPGLTTVVVYAPGFTGPQPGGGSNHDETYGAHATAAAVEVDPATGQVRILAALLVSDCGVVINPAVVEGQHRGGFAQGLGAWLRSGSACPRPGCMRRRCGRRSGAPVGARTWRCGPTGPTF